MQLPTSDDVLDRAIIVEKDMNESRIYYKNMKHSLRDREQSYLRKKNRGNN